VQYVLISLIICGLLLMTKKTDCYISLMAWVIGLVQLSELPFYPIFPAWYLLLTTAWVYASYFFLTVLSFQTLF